LGRLKAEIGAKPYRVCLSANQQRTLFGDEQPIHLACGSFACTYLTRDRVVKITRDPSDVAGLIRAQPHPRVVRVARPRYELIAAGREAHSERPVRVFALVEERLYKPKPHVQAWVARMFPFARPGGPLEVDARVYGRPTAELKRAIASSVCQLPPSSACTQFVDEFTTTWAQLARKGVPFRDVHQGNVMVDAQGFWKIVDLGLVGTALEKHMVKELRGRGLSGARLRQALAKWQARHRRR
jgi:hypothetical protein